MTNETFTLSAYIEMLKQIERPRCFNTFVVRSFIYYSLRTDAVLWREFTDPFQFGLSVAIYQKEQSENAWGFADRIVALKYLNGDLTEIDLAAIAATGRTVANISYDNVKSIGPWKE